MTKYCKLKSHKEHYLTKNDDRLKDCGCPKCKWSGCLCQTELQSTAFAIYYMCPECKEEIGMEI